MFFFSHPARHAHTNHRRPTHPRTTTARPHAGLGHTPYPRRTKKRGRSKQQAAPRTNPRTRTFKQEERGTREGFALGGQRRTSPSKPFWCVPRLERVTTLAEVRLVEKPVDEAERKSMALQNEDAHHPHPHPNLNNPTPQVFSHCVSGGRWWKRRA